MDWSSIENQLYASHVNGGSGASANESQTPIARAGEANLTPVCFRKLFTPSPSAGSSQSTSAGSEKEGEQTEQRASPVTPRLLFQRKESLEMGTEESVKVQLQELRAQKAKAKKEAAAEEGQAHSSHLQSLISLLNLRRTRDQGVERCRF